MTVLSTCERPSHAKEVMVGTKAVATQPSQLLHNAKEVIGETEGVATQPSQNLQNAQAHNLVEKPETIGILK